MSLALALLLGVPSRTAISEAVYADPLMHYSFRIPSGWRQLSKEELEENLAALEKRFGARPSYDAWFRPADNQASALPHFTVATQRCSMPTLRQIQEALAGSRKDELEKLKVMAASNSARITDPVIDVRRGCVTYSQEVRLPNGDVLQTDMALFPGRTGVARLYFFGLQPEPYLTRAARQSVLDSFCFDRGFEYFEQAAQPPTADTRFPWLVVGSLILVAVLVGWGCWRLARRSARPLEGSEGR